MATADYNQLELDEISEMFLPHYQQVWNKLKKVTKKTLNKLVKDPVFLASIATMPLAYHMNDKITHAAMGIAAYKVIDTISRETGIPEHSSKLAGAIAAIATGAGWEALQYLASQDSILSHTPLAGAADIEDIYATALGGIAGAGVYAAKDMIKSRLGKHSKNKLEELVEI